MMSEAARTFATAWLERPENIAATRDLLRLAVARSANNIGSAK
jgi:hypothetical protein